MVIYKKKQLYATISKCKYLFHKKEAYNLKASIGIRPLLLPVQGRVLGRPTGEGSEGAVTTTGRLSYQHGTHTAKENTIRKR